MKPFTTVELNVLSGLMLTLERDMRLTYSNASGKFANAKLIDADDDKFVLEIRNGIQSDCSNIVHTDIIVASRKHPGVILRSFEEDVLLVDEFEPPDRAAFNENKFTHLKEGDYLDIWQCNDCGAHAKTVEEIKHHATCQPGESDYWQEFYKQSPEDRDETF